MYIIEESIGLIYRCFTLCEGDLKVSHKTRAEQLAARGVQKDPHKLAKGTKVHTPRVVYKRKPIDLNRELEGYEDVTTH